MRIIFNIFLTAFFVCSGAQAQTTVYFSDATTTTNPATNTYTTASLADWTLVPGSVLLQDWPGFNDITASFPAAQTLKLDPNALHYNDYLAYTFAGLDITIDETFPDYEGGQATYLSTNEQYPAGRNFNFSIVDNDQIPNVAVTGGQVGDGSEFLGF